MRLFIPDRNGSVPDDQNAHISYLIASGPKSSDVTSAALYTPPATAKRKPFIDPDVALAPKAAYKFEAGRL